METNENVIPKEDEDYEEEIIQMTDEMELDLFSEDENCADEYCIRKKYTDLSKGEKEVVSSEDEFELTEEEYQQFLKEEEELENKDDAVLVFHGHRPKSKLNL